MFAAFLSTLCGTLLSVCVTALAAFAVTLIFKTSTTTNFAQGSIAALGCYVTADMLNKYGIPVYLGVLIGMAVGVLVGLFIDIAIFRNGKNVNAVGKQIITMGIVSIVLGGIPLVFGTPESIPFEAFYNTQKAGVSPNFIIPAFGGEVVITKHALICLIITVVVLGTIFLLLKFSRWGLGVLAAVMYAGSGTAINATFMTTVQVNAFLAGILGGFSTFYGPVLGAVCIPVAASCIGFLANFPAFSGISRWNMVIVYVLMLIVILIRPQGLLGKPVAKKV